MLINIEHELELQDAQKGQGYILNTVCRRSVMSSSRTNFHYNRSKNSMTGNLQQNLFKKMTLKNQHSHSQTQCYLIDNSVAKTANCRPLFHANCFMAKWFITPLHYSTDPWMKVYNSPSTLLESHSKAFKCPLKQYSHIFSEKSKTLIQH